MNDFFLQLAQMSRDIEGNGWLVIPNTNMPGEFRIRVEWHQFENILNFEQSFALKQIEHGNIDFSKVFVENANRVFRETVENL